MLPNVFRKKLILSHVHSIRHRLQSKVMYIYYQQKVAFLATYNQLSGILSEIAQLISHPIIILIQYNQKINPNLFNFRFLRN